MPVELHDGERRLTVAWVLKGALPVKIEAPDLNATSNAGRCWTQANRSATSPMPAAFATTPTSRENFAIGSATRQAVARAVE